MTSPHGIEHEGGLAPTPRSDVTRDRDWSDVRILSVEVEAGPRSVPPGHRRVRAGVYLGRLTPADVRVTLARPGSRADEPARDASELRLWSVRSYRNGSYVFERNVAEDVLTDLGRLKVRVGPPRAAGPPADD
jgi:hypothetical protein